MLQHILLETRTRADNAFLSNMTRMMSEVELAEVRKTVALLEELPCYKIAWTIEVLA